MSGSPGFWLAYAGVLVTIVAVDAWLGPVAEYLNAYELLRQALHLNWPARANEFLYGQARLGRHAYAVATIAWLVEGAIITIAARLGIAALR